MTDRRIILPYPTDDHDHPDDLNDLGLQADLNMLSRSGLDRRRVLALGAVGAITLLTGRSAFAQTATRAAGAACSVMPRETAGPFPGDGSQGTNLNVRDDVGVVRRDIRTSLKTKNTAAGVPLTLKMKLVNTNASCAPLSGYAVYAWQCDAAGNYSMYSQAAVNEDYLRGIQVSGADGTVTFQTVFPGCYPGRWPHIHFEVYPNLQSATTGGAGASILTSQLAFPEKESREVYADSRYSGSLGNLGRLSLTRDGIFRDSYQLQTATMTGNVKSGYAASITVGLAR